MDAKKAFIFLTVFGGGYLIFKAVKPKERKNLSKGAIQMQEEDPNDRPYIDPPIIDDEEANNNERSSDAIVALSAYISAYNAKEPQSVLDDLNTEISDSYGLKVYRRRSDNKLVVSDLNGDDILVYDN